MKGLIFLKMKSKDAPNDAASPKKRLRSHTLAKQRKTQKAEANESIKPDRPDKGVRFNVPVIPMYFTQPHLASGFTREEEEYLSSLPTDVRSTIESRFASVKADGRNVPLRIQILNSHLPHAVKHDALQKLKEGGREDFKYEAWIRNCLKLPLGVYENAPITRTTIDECRKSMNNCVHKHDNAKEEIVRLLCMSSFSHRSFAIGFEGPPGVGKTTFAKAALGCLNKEFCFISLGGASDASFLIGHSYTYEGSLPGKIARALQQSRNMSLVFYFDELDKISKSAKGEEVVSVLMSLIDREQSMLFSDRYFHGIPLDLSQCIFAFSYNNPNDVNPILLDRIKRVRMDTPDKNDRVEIARDFIFPIIIKEAGLHSNVVVQTDAIEKLVNAYGGGMRDVQKDLMELVGNVCVDRVINPHNTTDAVITLDVVRALLQSRHIDTVPCSMYM